MDEESTEELKNSDNKHIINDHQFESEEECDSSDGAYDQDQASFFIKDKMTNDDYIDKSTTDLKTYNRMKGIVDDLDKMRAHILGLEYQNSGLW